jgi:peptidoglycan/LPS O-acetylase OafA/YrhL
MASGSSVRHGTISSVHLNAIRGAAALVVLLGHTRDLFWSSLNGPLNVAANSAPSHYFLQSTESRIDRISMGDEAVIIFFVLSGYLVGGSVVRDFRAGRWSWKKYLTQRLTRLWIVLLPALLLGVALDSIGLRMFAGADSIYSGPPGLCIVPCNLAARLSMRAIAANALFLQTIVTDTAGSNNSLWSLANEFWYYLAFPLCLLAASKGQRPLRRGIYLALSLAVLTVAGKSISLLFLIWMLGVLVSVLPLTIPRRALGFASSSFILLLPVVLVLIRRAWLPRYLAEWMVALCFSIVLYLLLHRSEQAPANVYKSVAGFFSNMSYTLYLVHLPLAVFLCACINTPWHRWDKSPYHVALFLLLNVTLVFFSHAFYLLFEANTERVRHMLSGTHTSSLPLRRRHWANPENGSADPAPGLNARTLVIRSLLPERPIHLLDVGCGPISQDYPYADRADLVTCIDWQSQPHGPLPENVEFLATDFTSTELTPNAYDSVIAADVFEHILLEQEQLFIRKCVSALRPGGSMVISVPHQGTFACLDPYRVKPVIHRLLSHLGLFKGPHNGSCDIRKGHKHYSLDELVEKFHGLKVAKVVYFGYFFDPLASWAVALSKRSGRLPGFSWLQRAVRKELERDYGQRSFNIAVSFYKP